MRSTAAKQGVYFHLMVYFIEKQRAEKAALEIGKPTIEKVSDHLWIYHYADGTSIALDPEQVVRVEVEG